MTSRTRVAREGYDVDGSRFDAWTRRQFGTAAAGAAAAGLLGLLGLQDAAARHTTRHDGNKNSNKNKNKNKNNKNKQCRKTGQSCDETKKNKKCCNKNELCAQVKGQGGDNRCCKQNGEGCKRDSDCCGNDRCDGRKCRLPNN